MYNKKLLLLSSALLLTTSTTFAYAPYYQTISPFYLGGQVGFGDTHERESSIWINSVAIKDSGLAGRIFFGADLNPNWGWEVGLTSYSNPTIQYINRETDFSQTSLELLAKFSAPVNPCLRFYAKGGIAGVYQYGFEHVDGCDEYVRPIVGVGANYSLNRQVSLDVGAFHIFGTGYLEDTDFVGAGISFRIG